MMVLAIDAMAHIGLRRNKVDSQREMVTV